MAFWNRPTSISAPSIDVVSLSASSKKHKSSMDEFYEIEPAIVLDVILDKNHPYFNQRKYKLNPAQWPVSINGTSPLVTDLDYTWIGRVLIRLLYNQRNVEKEDLIWAMPLESNLSEFPLLNETVGVINYLGQYYYTRKINTFNTINANADFNLELTYGGFRQNATSIVQGNRELILTPGGQKIAYSGPKSKLNSLGNIGYSGVLGRYFSYNNRIRSLKHREGDLIVESRFGQSIRFGAYDDNRDNDKGYNSQFGGYADYKGSGTTNPFSNLETGGGNPMIIIRNRQRPLTKAKNSTKVYDNPSIPPVIGTDEEANVGGYILEDVNNDGSSIHITSGTTISGFVTNNYKKMWGNGSEEQSGFNGTTSFKYPVLLGDQIVINSDRIIISSKRNEMFLFSKKRMSLVSDDEFTIDAQNQIVFTTNNKTVLNSPAIYLGEYNQTSEPVLLGQTTVNWLYQMCGWMINHTHWYNHTHPDVGRPNPNQTQGSVQIASLIVLREQLSALLSRRVFVTGGGFAPGKDGGNIPNGSSPVSITPSGGGVPGGFSGQNFKT